MQPLSLEHRLALQELNHDFAFYLDHHQIDHLIALFTDDATYRHGHRVSQGKQSIEQLFRERKAAGDRIARHVVSGLRCRAVDEHRAAGNSVVVTWAANSSLPVVGAHPHLVADFVDEYELCSDGCWRISRREIERIFVAENNSGPIGV